MSEKIDIHNFKKMYPKYIEKIKKDFSIHPKNKDFILRYLRDSELGKTIRKGQKKKIGISRNLRVAGILKKMAKEWLRKPYDEVTQKDMENFILELERGTVLSEKGRPYTSETQKTIKKFIRKFWKWLKGDNKFYPPEVEWIDTSGEDADVCAIPGLMEAAKKMASIAPDKLKKAMIMTLADGGFREGEFLNLRYEDLTEEGDIYYVYIRHSKTFKRPVSLPIATPYLREWLKEYAKKFDREEIHSDAQIFPINKAFLYNNIKRLSKKALNFDATPQIMRHTSATYYAPRLERAVFCKRFGWSFSSRMPGRYIDWAKIYEKKTVEIVTTDEISKIKKENARMQEEINFIKCELSEFKKIFLKKYVIGLVEEGRLDEAVQIVHRKGLKENLTKLKKEYLEMM